MLRILSTLFPFLLYPKQTLDSSQRCGSDRILRTGWEAKDLESCIINRSLPSRKSGVDIRFDFAGEEGTVRSLDTQSSCLLPTHFLGPGYVLENPVPIVAVTCLRCRAPSGWENAGVDKPDAVCVRRWACVWAPQREN